MIHFYKNSLKYAIMLNGVTQLFMMKADVLNSFEYIKACTEYKTDEGTTDQLPYDMCTTTVEPVWKSIKGWNCETIIDIHNKIFDTTEANSIVNSIKICDPAVGSGHFLVSALNEIIVIKHDLGILQDATGKKLRDYSVEIVNDELIISDDDGIPFAYNPTNKESQRIQETLFKEKATIIENCLFGVDINPNSVKICRLRLWIELLKNAFYKENNHLWCKSF